MTLRTPDVIKSKNKLGAILRPRGANYSIEMENTSGVSIEDLKIVDCQGGINIINSHNCTMKGNDIIYKNKPGIYIDGSYYNQIIDNFIDPDKDYRAFGIQLVNSAYNNIIDNSIHSNLYILAFDEVSNNNLIEGKFNGLVFDTEKGLNCSVSCTSSNNILHCERHQENRGDCPDCRTCAIIGQKNNWLCIK